MSRWEFMRRLEELLSDIPPGEREEALKYYNDYINDGGKENEKEVLESLGTPEQVAAIIKEGLEGNPGEFTESGFQNRTRPNPNPVAKYQAPEAYSHPPTPPPAKSGISGATVALIVILCVLASPFIIGLGSGVFGLFVGVVAAAFSILLTFGILAVVFLAVGIVLIPVGIIRVFSGPVTGMALIAAGLILAGLGLLFLLLSVLIIGKLLPAIFRGVVSLCRSIFGGRKASNRKG